MSTRNATLTFGSAFLVALLVWPPAALSQLQRSTTMTCIACHADPLAGGFHGGFRSLIGLTKDEKDVVCRSCHDGSVATEAAVHQSPTRNSEYGTWKANCLSCHNRHYDLMANDGTDTNRNLMLMGSLVPESISTDGYARMRKPVINDVNGDNGGTSTSRYQDDIHTGWECSSGIPDDPSCVETDPPAAGDGVRKLLFFSNTGTAADHWAQSTAPYTGACNTCHTRTAHHRRDDSGGDHTHKIPQPCTNCHNHKDGWTNKGG